MEKLVFHLDDSFFLKLLRDREVKNGTNNHIGIELVFNKLKRDYVTGTVTVEFEIIRPKQATYEFYLE